ncbi:hypothetical protein D3C71_1039280 [compost metagenome]
MDVDQHAGKTKGLALLVELATTAGQHPQITAIGTQNAVLDVVGLAGFNRQLDPFLHPVAVIRMDPCFGECL